MTHGKATKHFQGERTRTSKDYKQYQNNPIKFEKWTDEESASLKLIVETMQKDGKVDWEQVGKQCNNRFGSKCYRQYIKITEPEWTTEQDEILGKCWEQNPLYFEISDVMPQLVGHTRHGALLRLEQLTEGENGKYKPEYRVG